MPVKSNVERKLIKNVFPLIAVQENIREQRTENEVSTKKQSLGMLLTSLLCNICNLEDKHYNFIESREAASALQFNRDES